jgi:hypothetical protein
MTDMQLVAQAVTLLAIVAAMYANRKSLEDARDVLRAEFKAGFAEQRAEFKSDLMELRAEMKDVTRRDAA